MVKITQCLLCGGTIKEDGLYLCESCKDIETISDKRAADIGALLYHHEKVQFDDLPKDIQMEHLRTWRRNYV